VSTAEYEENVRADVARVADACERSNDLSEAHRRISADMRDLNLRRYEYERLQDGIFVERQRMQRHHDVLCLVLKELVGTRMVSLESTPDREHVLYLSKEVADLAYPPPKDEP
jgi:hypothetical protein